MRYNKAFKSDSQRLALSLRSSIAKRCSHLNAALCAKNWIHIHAFVEDTDNFNILTADLTIKYYVASLWKLSVAIANFVTGFTNVLTAKMSHQTVLDKYFAVRDPNVER